MRLPESLNREPFNRDSFKLAIGVILSAAVLALAITGGSPGQTSPLFTSDPAQDTTEAEPTPDSPSTPAPSGEDSTQPQQQEKKAKASDKQAAAGAQTEKQSNPAPVNPRPKRAAPKQTVANPAPAAPAPAPKPDPEPKPKSAPKPTLTSARVRALPDGASLERVTSELGPATTTSALRARFGTGPTREMLKQEPDGVICRYYALAAGEPAPLIRICFDANGVMRAREYIGPPAG